MRHTIRAGRARLRRVEESAPVRGYTYDVDTLRLGKGAAKVVTRRAGIVRVDRQLRLLTSTRKGSRGSWTLSLSPS